jgi:hypothetical protein
MPVLSVDEQIAWMASDYPDFRVAMQAWWGAVWEGPLKPFDRPYVIRLAFYFGLTLGDCDLINWGPEVFVVQPDLPAEWGDKEPPHLYSVSPLPMLCLFDPRAGEWKFSMPLSATVVPWATQWLGFYELWRATGRWTGPERHPRRAAPAANWNRMPSPRLVTDPQRAARVAAAERTAASAPLLRAYASQRLPSVASDWVGERRLPDMLPRSGAAPRLAAV